MNDLSKPRPVQLHVIHDLGGGSAKWLADYVEADVERTNLILRSFAHDTAAGAGISLHASAAADAPAIRLWKWSASIAAATVSHAEYRAALDGIVRDYAIGGVIVSSLIGHSLEVLETGLPTLVVNHDYFPYCPAINLYFDSMCRSCDDTRVAQCEAGNPRFNPFAGFDPQARLEVRERFVELTHRASVTMVVPTRSVAENLKRLDSRFDDVSFATIAHGYGHPLTPQGTSDPGGGRLRILVLGQLSVAKGVELLREALDRITSFADLTLLGCRELGEEFRSHRHVSVVSDYDIDQLPAHIAAIRPHVGLLMSIVPETFSYALSELMMLGVPVAATRLGSFAERIRPGRDGYLFEPSADALVELFCHVDENRSELEGVRARIAGWRPRSASEMVADYHRALPVRASTPGVPAARVEAASAASPEFAAQAMAVASMWKDLKALHRRVELVTEMREREMASRREEDERRESERRILLERLENAGRHVSEQEAAIALKDSQIQAAAREIEVKQAHVAALLDSTSWKLSAPVRWVGRLARPLRTLARMLRVTSRNPGDTAGSLRKAHAVWKTGGMPALKAAIGRRLAGPPVPQASWDAYQSAYRDQVRPRIVARIAAMGAKPRISILMPTYNTPEDLLRSTIASVEAQLYPEWELCIADDGSTAPHLGRILREYAARDPRIKVDLAGANLGVSNASNRALAMATGEFTALLDHDDLLEEQALFRVAESVIEDSPDMVYSDEVEVERDGTTPRRFVYRPAFSPEYLRGHPYIVHMVAFRTALLREIGAFDESLRISQDYDLILRATEKARRIAHIPEILYRWRIHSQSAGHARMHEVMETSTGILQRHLDRSIGPGSRANPGAGFNLFEARYALNPGLRVAVVIPTRNHGEILRQCIDSIRATVKKVPYAIVVVDHDSDEPGTLRYLASVEPSVRVLRYSGAFNFSAINNRAVSQLGGGYTHYLFCNNDIEAVEPGWLERMLELGQQPSVGIVGAKLLYPDRRTIQHAGVCVGAFRAAEHYGKFVELSPERIEPGYQCNLVVSHEVSAVTAACLLIRARLFDEMGGFDESLAVGFGDVDLCLRALERGFRVLFCAHATLVHHESYTRGATAVDNHPTDTAQFHAKWKRFLAAGDPYYNPGLSLTSTTWAVRDPLVGAFEIQRRVFDRNPGHCDAVNDPQPLDAVPLAAAT